MEARQAVVENSVINSPFDAPRRRFRFSEEGVTNEIVEERWTSCYFIPIVVTKKKGKRLYVTVDWMRDRVEENKFINQVRDRVKQCCEWEEIRNPWDAMSAMRAGLG